MDLDDKSLKTLACDISVRPSDAAGIADVLPYVRGKKVDGHTVIVALLKFRWVDFVYRYTA